MGGHYEGNTWCFTQVLRATIVVEPREMRYRVLPGPARAHLHDTLDEDREDALWDALLNADTGDWEAFR